MYTCALIFFGKPDIKCFCDARIHVFRIHITSFTFHFHALFSWERSEMNANYRGEEKNIIKVIIGNWCKEMLLLLLLTLLHRHELFYEKELNRLLFVVSFTYYCQYNPLLWCIDSCAYWHYCDGSYDSYRHVIYCLPDTLNSDKAIARSIKITKRPTNSR